MDDSTNTSGEVKKLKIQAFEKSTYEGSPVNEFEVMFNPATYTSKYVIEYAENKEQGKSASEMVFIRKAPQDFNFEFIIDGTGASGQKVNVAEKTDKFLNVTCNYNGDIHKPNYLKLIWATELKKCVLKSADVAYTLFANDGTPLRAKITAIFSENIPAKLEERQAARNSPDLTHVRIVKETDKLPLMAYKILGDFKHYLRLAKFNQLDNFRNITAGRRLFFPPLNELP